MGTGIELEHLGRRKSSSIPTPQHGCDAGTSTDPHWGQYSTARHHVRKSRSKERLFALWHLGRDPSIMVANTMKS